MSDQSQSEMLQNFGEYQYGFSDPETFVFKSGKGLNDEVVRQISAMKGAFYPEIAVIWGIILSAFLYWQTSRLDPEEIFIAVLVCLFGGFITRIIAIKKDIKTPTF